MYPIDLLKVHCLPSDLQLPQGCVLTATKTRMQVVNPSPAGMYSGISNAMVTISRVEGIRTLWRGLSSVVLGAGWFG